MKSNNIHEDSDGSTKPGWRDVFAFVLAIYSYAVPLIAVSLVALLTLLIFFKWLIG